MAQTTETVETPTENEGAGFPIVTVIWLGAILLLFTFIVYLMFSFSQQPLPTDVKTPEQKVKFLGEWQAKESADAYGKPEWIDRNRDLVRIPVSDSMAILAKEAAENGGKLKPFRKVEEPKPPTPPAGAPPKKDEPKKDEPKKDEPKKDEPKKDEPKKDVPAKKDDPKKN